MSAAVYALLLAVPDAQLSAMRGGILLPDGRSIVVGIALETRVDGQLALRTQFSTETPGVQVFASAPGTVLTDVPPALAADGTPIPEIRVERAATGTTIGSVATTGSTTVRVGTLGAGEAARLPGVPLALTPGGTAVATMLGDVRLLRTAGGTITELTGPDLAIQQLVGQATGVIVANTANDRVIDTVTWVNVETSGFSVPSGLTSSIERVAQAVADRSRF